MSETNSNDEDKADEAVILPVKKFKLVFKDVTEISNKIISLYEEAKHNKKICGVLLDRAQLVKAAIENLQMRSKEKQKFFTAQNSITLRKISNVLRDIKEFIEKIYKLKNISKFIEPESIESTFNKHTNDFDTHMRKLKVVIIIDTELQVKRDKEALYDDIKETGEYLRQLMGNPDGLDNEKQIKSILKNIEEFTKIKSALFDEKRDQTNKVFNSNKLSDEPLEINKFDKLPEMRGKVQKWRDKSIHGLEVAFKKLNYIGDHKDLELQVKLLTRIKNSREIIQFFGLIKDKSNSSQYIVTEWAHYGSLREFYSNQEMDIHLRLQISLDIARGLNFLEAYEILHHDVRSSNVMIDHTKRAKIANFGMSRGFTDDTKGLGPTMENVRYMAPEKIKDPKHEYNQLCEVYSFGVLLWEIAEQKPPYHETNCTEVAMSNKILENQIQLKFKSDISEAWKQLVIEAIDHDPYERPDLKDMFKRLKKLSNPSISTSSTNHSAAVSVNNKTSSNIDNVLSVEEAINYTTRADGSKQKAWESFDAYSQQKDMTAKFYKAFYLYNCLVPNSLTPEERLQQAANLFKETADEGDMALGQFSYGICLHMGKGVAEDKKLAHEYYFKAANKGYSNAMFNVGIMYYKGDGVEKNIEEGTYWLKQAALGGVSQAVEYCDEAKITF